MDMLGENLGKMGKFGNGTRILIYLWESSMYIHVSSSCDPFFLRFIGSPAKNQRSAESDCLRRNPQNSQNPQVRYPVIANHPNRRFFHPLNPHALFWRLLKRADSNRQVFPSKLQKRKWQRQWSWTERRPQFADNFYMYRWFQLVHPAKYWPGQQKLGSKKINAQPAATSTSDLFEKVNGGQLKLPSLVTWKNPDIAFRQRFTTKYSVSAK